MTLTFFRPVNENIIGSWKFRLTAKDREGQSAQETLHILVRQYRRSRLVNHQFNIEFSFKDWDPSLTKNWQWNVRPNIAFNLLLTYKRITFDSLF